jgi:anti-anti-sigma factor
MQASRVGSLTPGQHALLAYSSDAEQIHVLAEFVRDGLERGERVFYFGDRVAPAHVAHRLSRRGIDTDRAIGKGHLTIGGARATKARWFDAIAETIAFGYPGMRVAADMSWAARTIPGAEDLSAYEESIADVFATKRVVGLCEFDRGIFEPHALAELEALHDVALDVHPVSNTPEMQVHFTPNSGSAEIAGEVDVYNRADFAAALTTVLATIEGDIHLHVANLRFIDIGGLTAIVRSAQELPPGARMILHGLQPHLRRVITLVGWDNAPNLAFLKA